MKKLRFARLGALGAVIIVLSACASGGAATNSTCEFSAVERESLLKLDYEAFDQSLPNGGWRKYEGCSTLIVDLIDAYVLRHEQSLNKNQRDVLVWHSGQLSAMAGDSVNAITKMQRTFKPNEKPTDNFLWNPYVKATIAFLRKDKPTLFTERQNLARGKSPINRVNVRMVDGLIRCFDFSYQVAYGGQCSPTETNEERIRSLAVPLGKKIEGVAEFLRPKKIILFGETHGTRSTPKVFGQLVGAVASAESKTLAVLEIPQSAQPSLDRFINSGERAVLESEPFFNREAQDGRSSKAMVTLLENLARLPNVTVLGMDLASDGQPMSGQERDTGMANFINEHRQGYDNVLVLSGNVHSAFKIGTPWDKNYRPMGYELKSKAKDLRNDQFLNVLFRYGKLEAWFCDGGQASSCQAHYGERQESDYSRAVNYPIYFVWEGAPVDGHEASLFLRTAKISKPFRKRTR